MTNSNKCFDAKKNTVPKGTNKIVHRVGEINYLVLSCLL